MTNYSFKEILQFFSEKLSSSPPEKDLDNQEVELVIDKLPVTLTGKDSSLHMRVLLGLLLQPIQENRLKELASSNFLGVNTGGCKLAFDEEKVALTLHCNTSASTSPQESWEWMHRLLCVAREWINVLTLWEEFVPLK